MTYVIACAASLLAGVVLGLVSAWPSLRDWRRLALDQSAVLHTGAARRRPFPAGPDDLDERNRRHR